MIKRTCCSCAILLLLLSVNRSEAHPHVWVTFHSDVLYAADGTMTGVRHAWTFDEMFSAYALQGIPHAKKGQYTRQELASLAHSHRLVRRTKGLAMAGMQALTSGRPVSVTAFHDERLADYVRETLASGRIGTIYVYSGQMGHYVPADFSGPLN